MGNSRGFTIVEILIAAAIAMIVALAAFLVLYNGTQNYEATVGKIEARKILSGASQALTRVFSYTYNLKDVGAAAVATNIALPASPGQLKTGTWASMALTGEKTLIPLANFRRDNGVGATAAAGRFSSYQQTGVFYITPSPTTSGVLFINLGAQTPMIPSYSNLYFDRITELTIDSQETAQGGAYLKSFRVKMTVRIFLKGEKAHWRWCPQADINANYANCNPITPYKDYKAELRIIIPNQVMRPVVAGNGNNLVVPERMLGPLYLFPLLN